MVEPSSAASSEVLLTRSCFSKAFAFVLVLNPLWLSSSTPVYLYRYCFWVRRHHRLIGSAMIVSPFHLQQLISVLSSILASVFLMLLASMMVVVLQIDNTITMHGITAACSASLKTSMASCTCWARVSSKPSPVLSVTSGTTMPSTSPSFACRPSLSLLGSSRLIASCAACLASTTLSCRSCSSSCSC